MTLRDIFAVMVIYNAKVADSLTYNSIKESGVQIIVCDNSTQDMGNADFCATQPNVHYIAMGGNVGLPKAYNAALAYLKGKEGIICLFDDDTSVPPEYFASVLEASRIQDADIFVPIILDELGMMSPNIMQNDQIKRAKSLSEIGDDIGAINSAMAVRTSVFQNFRYDENMFLDFVDYAFLREMKKQHKKIYALEDVVLHQTFSANVDSKESAKRRFQILKQDLKYFYKDTPCIYRKVILRRAVHLCLKFKTLQFLFQ